MRLNRFMSVSGASSRRQGENLIRSGKVSVNGRVITDPAHAVDPHSDVVALDGVILEVHAEKRYFLLNKPTGVIVSASDTHGRATVMDLLDGESPGLFPVGRLDMDTSGVLLLTDDGDLANRLMHPSFGVEKVYRAEVEGSVGKSEIRIFQKGLVLDDGPAAPAKLNVLRADTKTSRVEVTMHQGRKRQVRRMFEIVGRPVMTLERVSFGGITADSVSPGSYRFLSDDEVALLKKMTGLEKNQKSEYG